MMRLGSRLLLVLLPTVIVIMVVFAGWSLVARERTMVPAAQQETRAYATALGLALEGEVRDVRSAEVLDIINQVSRTPTIYGIILYDSVGTRVLASDPLIAPQAPPPDSLRRVIRGGGPVTLERMLDDQRVFSVLQALHGPKGAITGVLEVAQPLAFIEAQKAQVRRRFLLNTMVLLLAVGGTTLWLVQRVVTGPMQRLVHGARVLGSGDLAHRIEDRGRSTELALLAREFNGMARNLEGARQTLVREAEERVRLERRLRETEKLAAIGNIAAGVAHEVAGPLNVISGRAELLLRRVPAESDQARQLQIIIRQIGRITTTVQNLLGFAKRRELVPSRLDLAQVLEGVLEFLEAEFTRGQVRVVKEGGGPVWVGGDAELLHDVLVNLLLNAAQAVESSEGDRQIAVRLGAGTPRRALVPAQTPMPSVSDESAWAVLEVQDSGPGIAAEALPRLFEPYFTTKVRGTGLGLVVAQSIVQEHGGWLDARNTPETGAIFRVVLPPWQEPSLG